MRIYIVRRVQKSQCCNVYKRAGRRQHFEIEEISTRVPCSNLPLSLVTTPPNQMGTSSSKAPKCKSCKPLTIASPTPPSAPPSPPVASALYAKALAEINLKRALHGVPPVTLQLGEPGDVAIDNAKTVAASFCQSGLVHTGNTGKGPDSPKVGQNIYAITLGGSTYNVDTMGDLLKSGIEMWYDEIDKPTPYFTGGGKAETDTFQGSRGHFTQLVWKNSTHVSFGVALAQCANTQWLILVTNFSPPGNVVGQFTENVLPPKYKI